MIGVAPVFRSDKCAGCMKVKLSPAAAVFYCCAAGTMGSVQCVVQFGSGLCEGL